MAAVLNRLEVGLERTGSATTVPATPVAKISYYLNCMCSVLNLDDSDININKLKDYPNYWRLSEDEIDALVLICAVLSPDKLIGKCIFNDDSMCGGSTNRFYELSAVQNRVMVTDNIILQGQRRQVSKVMFFKMEWLQNNYLTPMQSLVRQRQVQSSFTYSTSSSSSSSSLPITGNYSSYSGVPTGCCSAYRIVSFFNFVWFGLAAACLIGGILLQYNWYVPMLHKYLHRYSNTVDMGTVAEEFLAKYSCLLIIPGTVCAVIALTGILGSCKGFKWLIKMNYLLLGLIVLAEIAGLVTLGSFKRSLQQPLIDSVKYEYKGVSNTTALVGSPFSTFYNSIMIKFECCGIVDKNEFNTSKSWNRTYIDEKKEIHKLVYPIACCKNYGEFPENYPEDIQKCVKSPENRNTSCWSYVDRMMSGNIAWFWVSVSFGLLFQLMMIFAGRRLINHLEQPYSRI